MELTNDQVRILSCAVVEQAVLDYRNILVQLKDDEHPRLDDIKERIDLEIFFRSEFCNFLQDEVDGKKIITIIRNQVKTGEIPSNRKRKRK